jgi:hypothetical protein
MIRSWSAARISSIAALAHQEEGRLLKRGPVTQEARRA